MSFHRRWWQFPPWRSIIVGATWELTVPIDITPYQGAFSPHGAIELKKGEEEMIFGNLSDLLRTEQKA